MDPVLYLSAIMTNEWIIKQKYSVESCKVQDSYGNILKICDTIIIIKGQAKGLSGIVRFIEKSFLFVQCKSLETNLGYCCVKPNMTKIAVKKYDKMNLISHDETKKVSQHESSISKLKFPHNIKSETYHTKSSSSKFEKRNINTDHKSHKYNSMNHAKVVILNGPLRNYVGIVVDDHEDSFLIEMEAQYKKVMVKKM
jgi:transcription elongation factor